MPRRFLIVSQFHHVPQLVLDYRDTPTILRAPPVRWQRRLLACNLSPHA